MQLVDHVIVGHGIAGATLAIEARRRGQSVVVLDGGRSSAASRVAAGLITPITGKRFARRADFTPLRTLAFEHYRACERALSASFLFETSALRIFRDAEERSRFDARREELGPAVRVVESPDESLRRWRSAHGAFEMPSAARLDVRRYLDAHAAALGADLVETELDDGEIGLGSIDGLELPRLGLCARRLTFCRGYADRENRFFPELLFEAAKGEVLELRMARLPSRATVHFAGLWLARDDGARARFGASYDHETLDSVPTPEVRLELERRLRASTDVDFEVCGHAAAVRPVVSQRRPVCGVSRIDARVGILNGLGSKGALFAPSIARMYVDAMQGHGLPLPHDFDVQVRFGGDA